MYFYHTFWSCMTFCNCMHCIIACNYHEYRFWHMVEAHDVFYSWPSPWRWMGHCYLNLDLLKPENSIRINSRRKLALYRVHFFLAQFVLKGWQLWLNLDLKYVFFLILEAVLKGSIFYFGNNFICFHTIWQVKPDVKANVTIDL